MTATGAQTLKAELGRSERRHTVRMLALVAPLLLFLIVNFVVPIGLMLFRGIEDPEARRALPRTIEALSVWDGGGIPQDGVARLLVAELTAVRGGDRLSALANRLNYDVNGLRSLLLRTVRNLPPDTS